ncbi:MAG: LysR family transcriptional regulator [Verrucomicrobia bacterium]|nr:MAG: LysR family transcriptional regulator [Verrucomicrobiota bacterium]
MEFHQLRYFVAAAEEGSISRAASKLHLSQPALSRQIFLLEEELRVKLFERVKQRIVLNDAGRFFLNKAKHILRTAELSRRQVAEHFGVQSKQWRLGCISPLIDDLVIPVVKELKHRQPQASVTIFDLTPREQIERLKSGELDLAILGNMAAEDRLDVSVKKLCRQPMNAVLPDEHRLSKRKSIKLVELRDEAWISLAETFFPNRRTFFINGCDAAGFTPTMVSEEDSIPAMFVAIAMGHGVGLLPAHAKKISHHGCRFIPISTPVIHTELLLLTQKSPQPVALSQLVELIEQRAKILLENG